MKTLSLLTLSLLAMTLISCRSTTCSKKACHEPFTLLTPMQNAVLTQHTQAQSDFNQLLIKPHTQRPESLARGNPQGKQR